MVMDNVKLQNAAKSGLQAFSDEWLDQEGVNDPPRIISQFNIFKDPNALKNATSKTSRSSGGVTRGGPLDTGDFAQDIIRAGLKSKAGDMGEASSLEKGLDALQKVGTPLKMLESMANLLKYEVLVYLDEQSKLLMKINEETGMTGKLSEDFRQEIMDASPEVIRLGISFEELSTAVSTVVTESGKFKLLSSDTIKEMALASKFAKDMTELGSMGKDFQDIGLGIKDMSLLIEKMGLKSLTLGLNARTTTKMVDEQLKNLNSYGFKNGVEGLNRMAQKSIEFRMNMNDVFKVADKVWDPAGALEMSANLQVMGTAFGALNDPIKMMYMATNDVEGLQDAITGAAKSLVTYNTEQGRFQVTGANLRRAKEMAKELNMNLEDLTKTAVASMERTQAATDLMGSGLNMKDEDKEFLTNLAQMKSGRMVIEVPENLRQQLGVVAGETSIALQDMGQKQVEALLDQKKAFEAMDMKDVALRQVTAIENVDRNVSFLRAVARVAVGKDLGDAIEKYTGINQAMLSGEAYKLADIGEKYIRKGDGVVRKLIGLNPGLSAMQKANAPTGATNATIPPQTKTASSAKSEKGEPVVTKSVVELKVSAGDVSMDEIKRALFNNLDWMNKSKKEFIYNNLPIRN